MKNRTLPADQAGIKDKIDRRNEKRSLMQDNPKCTGCGEHLTFGLNCCMAAEHLFCNHCINFVRQKRRGEQNRIIEIMKRVNSSSFQEKESQ